MERNKLGDLIAAVAVMGASAAGVLALRNVPFRALEAGLGPAFFPAVAVTALAILGLLLLLKTIARPSACGVTSGADAEGPRLHALCGMGVLVGYAVLFLYVGCLLATQIALFTAMRLLGATWSRAFIFATGATTCIYLLFGLAFGVRL